MRRPFLFSGLCFVVLVGSFFLTLLIIGRSTPHRATVKVDTPALSERLARYRVASYSELPEIASQLGLKLGANMRGHTDVVTRLNERDVMMKGWIADPDGDATPNELMVFLSGKLAARTKTTGERPDVQRELNLEFGTEKNVAFQVTFACQAGDQPVAVALGQDGRYFGLDAPRCP